VSSVVAGSGDGDFGVDAFVAVGSVVVRETLLAAPSETLARYEIGFSIAASR